MLTLLVREIFFARQRWKEIPREDEGEEERDEKRRRVIGIEKREGHLGENAGDMKIFVSRMRQEGEEEL